MENKLILTVGLPRSGKSTWAVRQQLPVVNRDAIRLALHGQAFIKETEHMVTAIETYMVKSLFLAGHDKVIVDATHMTDAQRHRWKSKDWDVYYKTFNTSKDECIKRALSGSREDLVPIIESMYLKFEPIGKLKKIN